MAFFYVAITLIVLYYTAHYYFKTTFNYWKKRNVVSAPTTPLMGNFKEYFLQRKHASVLFQEIYNMFPDEKVVGLYTMTKPALLIRDLDIIKQIMIKDFDLFVDRGVEYSEKGLNANLFNTKGDTWRSLRNRLTPLFTSSKLKNMFYLIDERVDKILDYVDSERRIHSELEVYSLLQKFTMASISACAFGVDVDTLTDKQDALKHLDKLISTRNALIEILYELIPSILKLLNISKFPVLVSNFFYDLVRTITIQRGGKPSNRKDLMDLMLELRQEGTLHDRNISLEITDDFMAAQAYIFYLAGYDTTATTLTYLLYRLAVNPEVQNKLCEEIDESLRMNDGKITFETLAEMKYLGNVISETLRMHSAAQPLLRSALADYKVPGTDVVLRKGQLVFVTPAGIHYDEKYYPRPHVFDPERFSPDVAGNRHPCAFLPFGVGPRNCIGLRFSQVQSCLFMVKLLLKFRVEPSSTTKKTLEIDPRRTLVCPKGGIHLRFVPRTWH